MYMRFTTLVSFLIFKMAFSNSNGFTMTYHLEPELYRPTATMQERWAYAVLSKQEKWAYDVLSSVDLKYSKILDIGSGRGNITSSIARQYPKSIVIGIEPSSKMVHFANRNRDAHDNVFFVEGDAQKLFFDNQFDVVCSFSTLHRLHEPRLALEGIYRALKPGGRFIAAFPAKVSDILIRAITQIDTSDQWKDLSPAPDRKTYSLSAAVYRQLLTEVGFTVIKAETEGTDEIYETREKFRDFLRVSFNHYACLPPHKEIAFFSEVVNEYLREAPFLLDKEGRVKVYVSHIEIFALKPGSSTGRSKL